MKSYRLRTRGGECMITLVSQAGHNDIVHEGARVRCCWLCLRQTPRPLCKILNQPMKSHTTSIRRSCNIVLHAMFGMRKQIFEYSKPVSRLCDRTDTSSYWNSQNLFIRLQIGAGIYAVLTASSTQQTPTLGVGFVVVQNTFHLYSGNRRPPKISNFTTHSLASKLRYNINSWVYVRKLPNGALC